MCKYLQFLLFEKIARQLFALYNRQIAVGILLIAGGFHSALAADDQLNNAVRIPDSLESKPAVKLESVTVTGTASGQSIAPNESALKGRALQLQLGDTLGKTLDEELGISNASFGPGVGIPVIRGLTGSRVRMLQNGIGSHDATSLGPDHAATIEPLFAEEINILRGPETIRYGGNAIGGIVDVKDYRIPERIPRNLASGSAESRYETNGSGTSSALRLNLGKEHLALSLGGFFRDRGNIRIPGSAVDERFITQQPDYPENVQNAWGKIPNSDNQSKGGFVGFSWLGQSVMAGMSVSHTDNQYGIPPGSHGSHHETERDEPAGFEPVSGHQELVPDTRIAMRQTRYDFKGEWYDPVPGIERVGFRYGLVDYRHTEKEGAISSTLFKNNAGEGRFEVDHHLLPSLTGTFGAQWIGRDFSALGKETFIPKTRQDSLGLYTTQKYTRNNWVLSGGLRFEQSWVDPRGERLESEGGGILPSVLLPDKINHQALSVSTSAQWKPLRDFSITLLLNHGERAPDIQELLSLGPHLSTRSFDIGNAQLSNETMNTVDLGFDWQTERLHLRAGGYYSRANNFIYQRNTGVFYEVDNEMFQRKCISSAECVPVLTYDQRDAEFIGYEAEIEAILHKLPQGAISLTLFSDYVRARFVQGDRSDVPRIPPLRFGAELGIGNSHWSTALRYTRAEAQNYPGKNEIDTRGYHLLTASVDYQIKAGKYADFQLFAKGNNLLNEEIRSAASFLRGFAPEPGRSATFGVRATF